MKYLLIAALLFTACSKSDDKEIQSATGVWYVNGVAHTPDVITRLGASGIEAKEDGAHKISIYYFNTLPSKDRIDTLGKSANITVVEGHNYSIKPGQTVVIGTSFSGGNMVVNIPAVQMQSGGIAPDITVSGTIIYDLP